jgi:flagellar basal body P-ring formation protein FlgA
MKPKTDNNPLKSGLLAGLIVGFCQNISALAQPFEVETTQRLLHTAKQFITLQHPQNSDLEIKFGYIDARLRLPRCNESLQGYFPDQGATLGSTLVGVQCSGNSPWKVVIPVQIRAYANVVVAREPLSKDTMLQPGDLYLARKELSASYGGAFTKLADVSGMVLKQPVNKDTVLAPHMLKPKRLVERGESVTILANYQDLIIHVQGTALMDGQRGQIIRVQNTRSGREIQAEVIDPALVQVKM